MNRAALVLALVLAPAWLAACGDPTATREAEGRAELTTLRARFPRAPLQPHEGRAARAATVTLPATADGEARVEDPQSGVAVGFRLEGAPASQRADVDGVSIYRGAGIVHVAHASGLEDSVVFESRPAREELRYRLDVRHVAGLRLVDRSLELLDASGTPRLRVDPPYVLGTSGARREALLDVKGCAIDRSPAAPWHRPLTAPGSDRCDLLVRWSGSGIDYPALVDPSWALTTDSGTARDQHAAVKLASGHVLLVGGQSCDEGCFNTHGSELYDPATQMFASGGSPPDPFAGAPAIGLPNGKALILDPLGTLLYDPTSSSFNGFTTMPAPDYTGALTLLASGTVLIAGSTATLYDPVANDFAPAATLNVARSQPAAALLPSGQVLVAGGGVTSAEVYDPVANTFTLTSGSMAAARTGAYAFTLPSGQVLVLGGGPDTTELYDPTTEAFTPSAPFLVPNLTGFAAVQLVSGDVMIVGGFIPGSGGAGPAATPTTELYSASNGTMAPGPTMVVPRGFLGATTLDDGSVLATYGLNVDSQNFSMSLSTAEVLTFVGLGGACSADSDCGSGICSAGVCCSTACTGVCFACTATGLCAPVLGADDPDSCTGPMTCDATGACKEQLGQPCTAGSGCVDGLCVDGVCCDSACGGTCEACNALVPGTCGPVAGAPHGARACTGGSGVCGGACDGVSPSACAYPGEDIGCGTSCSSATFSASACDGKGGCAALTPRACPGNLECESSAACRTSCTGDSDCVATYVCENARCEPHATCDGDHDIVSADGTTKTDCSPFRCDSTNSCLTSCTSVAGCANPFVCNTTGACVAAEPATSSGGCAVGEEGNPSRAPSAALLTLLAVLARRRLRARQSS